MLGRWFHPVGTVEAVNTAGRFVQRVQRFLLTAETVGRGTTAAALAPTAALVVVPRNPARLA